MVGRKDGRETERARWVAIFRSVITQIQPAVTVNHIMKMQPSGKHVKPFIHSFTHSLMQIIYWKLGDCVVCARSLLGPGSQVSGWAQVPPSRTWGSGQDRPWKARGTGSRVSGGGDGHPEESDRATVSTVSARIFTQKRNTKLAFTCHKVLSSNKICFYDHV